MLTKTLKLRDLINLAIISFGMQFVNSLQLSNMSSLFRFLGAPHQYISYLGLAAPISGLIIQPIVGQLSDETFTPYGKRRPYIFGWSILACIACFLIAFTNTLWLSVILIWILSCSSNGAAETLRALIGDIVTASQKVEAFALQTILAGGGAGLAALLPYIFDTIFPNKNLSANSIPFSLRLAFIIGAFVWLGSMLWTLKQIKEYIPKHGELIKKIKSRQRPNWIKLITDIFFQIFKNIKKMPKVMKQYGLVQIFTWFAIFSIWLFFNNAIAQHFYGLPYDSNINNNLAEAKLLERGTIQANFYNSIYQYTSVFYAVLLIYLGSKFPQKLVYGVSLIIGAIGFITLGFITSPQLAVINMIAVGIMWGATITLPYSIISSEMPRHKMGVYFGLFNITITLPQIIASFILHPIYVYIFKLHAMYIITLSGVLIFIAGVFAIYFGLGKSFGWFSK